MYTSPQHTKQLGQRAQVASLHARVHHHLQNHQLLHVLAHELRHIVQDLLHGHASNAVERLPVCPCSKAVKDQRMVFI